MWRAGNAANSAHLHWDDIPLALVQGKHLRAITTAAAKARVRIGMSVAESRVVCAEVDCLEWDPETINTAITRTTAALLEASPQITPVVGSPGTWWIGAGGMDAVGGETKLTEKLHRITSHWHPAPRIAVADSCVAARAATWSAAASRGEHVIVPRGGCSTYLFRVPLAMITMQEELRSTLHALGITTAGGFAALEGEDVERRWGQEGLLAWKLCKGDDRRRPVLARAAVERSVSADLAQSTHTVEPLIFIVNAALTRLVGALVEDARAAAAVAITLVLDNGRGPLPVGGTPHTITREVRPARPLARVAPLRELCRSLLESWKLTAPICGVTVSITATAPTSAEQGNLLDREWRDPAAAQAALDRLRTELGAGSVVKAVANNTHRPEQAGMWVDLHESGATVAQAPEHANGESKPGTMQLSSALHKNNQPGETAALRLLDPPEPALVECAGQIPRVLKWRSRVYQITQALGPERLSGEWWKQGYKRDYWHCHDNAQQLEIVLFRDREAGAWYIQGWWD